MFCPWRVEKVIYAKSLAELNYALKLWEVREDTRVRWGYWFQLIITKLSSNTRLRLGRARIGRLFADNVSRRVVSKPRRIHIARFILFFSRFGGLSIFLRLPLCWFPWIQEASNNFSHLQNDAQCKRLGQDNSNFARIQMGIILALAAIN